MTDKEKAKAYDEALKEAVAAYKDEDRHLKATLGRIFPELKESEDEKIRKSIIAIISNYVDNSNTFKHKMLDWLEKQGEQKSTDKLKFHEGDWVVFAENHNSIYQVERIDNYRYYLRHYLGGTLSLHFDNELIRLWTLQDAKDGDILYSLDSKQPFIYKNRKPFNQAEAYCGINIFGKFFVWNTKDCAITLDKYVPATKEQRELLFKKMREAGYEWDDKEKKPIKSEAICMYSTDNYTDKERETLCEGCEVNCKYNHAAWSEEDENILKNLTDYFMVDDCLQFKEGKIVKWLESLKNRIKGE